jgi:thiamine phosphate synthase YjbQ (UPF0047 family)
VKAPISMPIRPVEFTLELTPRARVDVIDVRRHIASKFGDALNAYPRALCCSFHTTAGYLDRGVAARLGKNEADVMPYIDVFRTMFPEGAGYEHDKLDRRTELTEEQKPREPLNADSHLAFMAGALRTCVAYPNRRGEPIAFVDLDGIHAGHARRRRTTVLGYTAEETVAQSRVVVPVSSHSVDSINLKDPSLGVYDTCAQLVARHGVAKGRLRLTLAPGEHHAGLTVNEYETLLMKNDLVDVLRDPLRFAKIKARHVLNDPLAVPGKTLNYAKYDVVRVLNSLMEALRLDQSSVERFIAKVMSVPARRFLRSRRVSFLAAADAGMVRGTYQSPIMVQWQPAEHQARRIDVVLVQLS